MTSAGGYLRIMFAIVPNQLMDRQFILYSREYFLFSGRGIHIGGRCCASFQETVEQISEGGVRLHCVAIVRRSIILNRISDEGWL